MHKTLRLISWIALGMVLWAAAPVLAIEFVVNRVNGDLYLRNESISAETIDGYSVSSPGEALGALFWDSIADNYDSNSGGTVDASAEWFVLSSTASSIAEASTTALSTMLQPGQVVNLGKVWDDGEAEDYLAVYSAGTVTTPVAVHFIDLYGDYNSDLVANLDDHTVFVNTYGSTTDLRADGNQDGVIDSADYTIWRDSYELSLSSTSELSIAHATAWSTPEPGSLVLLVTGVMGFYSARNSRC